MNRKSCSDTSYYHAYMLHTTLATFYQIYDIFGGTGIGTKKC